LPSQTVQAFIEEHLPRSPARVLEVGCGQGDLARALATSGHEVVAIDPAAPEGDLFQPVSLENFSAREAFDAVVASRSLHHILDLPESVAKIARLLRPGGRFVLDEHACDRLDDRTARWSFLHRVGRADAPSSLTACCAEWEADHDGLHGYAALREQLDRHFVERYFSWMPYLYRELGNVDEDQERAAIDNGTIQAMGFRYVGEPLATA
jgi:SAM-dependent methyltransferase